MQMSCPVDIQSVGPMQTRVIDRIILVLLGYMLASLPFAVVDFLLPLVFFNRLVLVLVGVLCAFSALGKRGFNLTLNGTFIVLAIILVHSFFSIMLDNTFDYVKELITLMSLVAVVLWSKDVRVEGLARFAIGIAVFYSLDAIFQNYTGTDWFGFTPWGNRSWGAFNFGAPTLGVFLAMVIFLPFFFIKNTLIKWLFFLLIALGMVVANDRAPMVQVVLAALLFSKLRLKYKLLTIGCVLAPIFFVPALPPATSNRIIALYWGLHLFLFGQETSELKGFYYSSGIEAYGQIWGSILTGWFQWDNIFNVIFGTGWGSSFHLAERFSGLGRPHSIHLELLVSWGILGYAAVIAKIFHLFLRYRACFIILASAVLPFTFFSLVSFNPFFLMVLNYMFFVSAVGSTSSFKPQDINT